MSKDVSTLCELEGMTERQTAELVDAMYALYFATDAQKEQLDDILKKGNIQAARELVRSILTSVSPYCINNTMKLIGGVRLDSKRVFENQQGIKDICNSFDWRLRFNVDSGVKDMAHASIYDAYLFGFICGQRAERSRKKNREKG